MVITNNKIFRYGYAFFGNVTGFQRVCERARCPFHIKFRSYKGGVLVAECPAITHMAG